MVKTAFCMSVETFDVKQILVENIYIFFLQELTDKFMPFVRNFSGAAI